MRLPRSRRRDRRQSGPLVRTRRRRGGCQRTARRAKAQGKGVGGISKPSRSMSSEPPPLSASQARTGLLDAGSGQGGPAVKIIEADSRSSAMLFTKRITANTLPTSGLHQEVFPTYQGQDSMFQPYQCRSQMENRTQYIGRLRYPWRYYANRLAL